MGSQNAISYKGADFRIDVLRDYLESNEAIDMAFLFGSMAKGTYDYRAVAEEWVDAQE